MLKKNFILLAILLVVAPLLPAPARADDPAALEQADKEKDIRKLMEITGAAGLGNQVADQMMQQFRSQFPQVPNDLWNDLRGAMKPDEVADRMVPIYDHHLSHDDIKGLIQFYESPLGQKVIHQIPLIMQEDVAAAQVWGQQWAQRIGKTLKEKGYIKG